VFAESEVASLVARGEERRTIAFGLHKSVVRCAAGMLRRAATGERPIMFSGGVAKNGCLAPAGGREAAAAGGHGGRPADDRGAGSGAVCGSRRLMFISLLNGVFHVRHRDDRPGEIFFLPPLMERGWEVDLVVWTA